MSVTIWGNPTTSNRVGMGHALRWLSVLAQQIDGVERCFIEPLPARFEMSDDGMAHFRLPEAPDMILHRLGGLCGRFMGEKLGDLIGHVNQPIIGGFMRHLHCFRTKYAPDA